MWPVRWHNLCYSLASGKNQREAAKEVGYTENRVSLILRNKAVHEKIERLRKEFAGPDIQARFSRVAPKALDVMEKVIDGTTPSKLSEQIDASRWMLEKVTGKPKQEMEVKAGVGVVQVIELLESMKKQREAGEVLVTEVTEKDPLEQWVDDHVPELKSEKT